MLFTEFVSYFSGKEGWRRKDKFKRIDLGQLTLQRLIGINEKQDAATFSLSCGLIDALRSSPKRVLRLSMISIDV